MNNERITREKLNELAKENKIKYYLKYNRFELAEKLGIELPRPKPKPKSKRVYSRTVQIQDKIFPSMTNAAKVLGLYPVQIYAMVANGDAKFL